MIATLALLTLLSPAQAQEAVKLEVVRKGQKGLSNPGLVLLPQVEVSRLDAKVECGGAWAEHKGGAASGERIELMLDVNPGSYTCTGSLSLEAADGTTGEMPLRFDITMFDSLKIGVDKSTIDLARGTMTVTLDRPAQKVEIKTYGFEGQVLGQGTTPGNGLAGGTPIETQWSPAHPEVLRMEVRGFDVDGFWTELLLFPWYYEIPHEDVVFESAQAVVRPGEVYKLEDAKAKVDDVVGKYGSVAEVNLYVAGYTDTVGDHSSNLYLSEKRAAAIAGWFRDKGFDGHIYYQGFGEKGLAVATPDEVDELANRRATYVVAAEPPPVTSAMPGSSWKKIK